MTDPWNPDMDRLKKELEQAKARISEVEAERDRAFLNAGKCIADDRETIATLNSRLKECYQANRHDPAAAQLARLKAKPDGHINPALPEGARTEVEDGVEWVVLTGPRPTDNRWVRASTVSPSVAFVRNHDGQTNPVTRRVAETVLAVLSKEANPQAEPGAARISELEAETVRMQDNLTRLWVAIHKHELSAPDPYHDAAELAAIGHTVEPRDTEPLRREAVTREEDAREFLRPLYLLAEGWREFEAPGGFHLNHAADALVSRLDGVVRDSQREGTPAPEPATRLAKVTDLLHYAQSELANGMPSRAAAAIAEALEHTEGTPAPEPAGMPDDLRESGWRVAVHNDYRLNGKSCTFWLMTKDGRAVKGEGLTDAEALDEVRKQVEGTPGSTEPAVCTEPVECPYCLGGYANPEAESLYPYRCGTCDSEWDPEGGSCINRPNGSDGA